MKIQPAILMITAILTACGTKHENYNIRWNSNEALPLQKDGRKHIGIAGPIAGIIGDKLIIAGGANFPDKKPWEGGIKQYSPELYIFKIDGDKISLQSQHLLSEPIAYVGNCSLNDALYIAGGENQKGVSAEVKKITFTQDSVLRERLTPLPLPLTNGSLVSANNKLYYIGGENQDLVSDKIYCLDLSIPRSLWEELSTLPYPVTHAVVVSNKKNKILVVGGRKRNNGGRSTIYSKIFEFDIPNNNIIEIGTLPEPLAAGTGILDSSGDLLIFGGDNAETFHKVESIIAEIGETKDPIQKEILNTRKAQIQDEHPGFSNKSWSYNIAQKKWSPLTPIKGESPVTTLAITHGELIIIPSGEKSAGIRTDQILIGKIERN